MEHIHNTLTVPCEKYEMLSFAPSIMTNIVVFTSRSRFAVKLMINQSWRKIAV